MWHSGDAMGWWMLFGSVWFVVFWAVLIWAIAKVTFREPRDQQSSPLDIAKRRYASGEISREEFEQLRHDLT
jgi:putative membrane protein